MKRRSPSADVILLVVAIVLFAAFSFQMSSHTSTQKEGLDGARRTTNSDSSGGWRAFYLLLQGSGLKAERWSHRPSTWPADARVMVTSTEYAAFSDEAATWTDGEVESALKWVDNGGTLLIISDHDSQLLNKLNLHPSGGDDQAGQTLTPAQPAAMLGGVHEVSAPEGHHWDPAPGNAVVLLHAGASSAAIVFPHGKGKVVAVCSAAMADNLHIGEKDNARFLTQMVASLSGDEQGAAGRVLFDEFHQGYNDDSSLWGIIGQNGHLIVLQIVAIALIAGYSASRRFGLPQPLPAAPRVSSEYVRSLADLYRRGRAGDAALEGIYRSFRRDLCRSIGFPLDTPVKDVAQAAAASLAAGDKDVAHRLQVWMDACEAKISSGVGAVPDNELLQIARELQSLRKELQLGGTGPSHPV